MNKFRYYQKECCQAIDTELQTANKCIVKMFCGTGKSLIMRYCQSIASKSLIVYVFPSLSLIDQFYNDYLKDAKCNILKVSSESESTTNPSDIQRFLRSKNNKIICVTYQSFGTLLENIGTNKINVCVYDEAHHAVGESYQSLIFNNDSTCEKQIFFTATPKNTNGIVMYDLENDKAGDCGNLVYNYSYYRGVQEGYLNPFELRIDMYSENTSYSIYESIARAILITGNNRVLTFHSDVNTDRDTSVNNFVNQDKFLEAFQNVRDNEFPDNDNYTSISFIGLDGSSESRKNRKNVLEQFDTSKDTEIFIISSCETIGEGIDTKNANMVVFVDPRTSYVKIIQNIGRVVRKQFGIHKPHSTILLPCWVDKTKYLECNGDREKCDEVIREDMGKTGNFNSILNVMCALRQEDEDMYEQCLNYADKYSPKEIKDSLESQGYQIVDMEEDCDNIFNTVEYLLDTEIDRENYEDIENDDELIQSIADDNNISILMHSDSLENPIVKYQCEEGEDSIRVYKETETNDDGDEEIKYRPIIGKDGTKKNLKKCKRPSRDNIFRIKVHTNPDITVLWNAKNINMSKDIASCVLDCEVVDNWYEMLEQLEKFIDNHGFVPSGYIYKSYNKKINIGSWITQQLNFYKKKQHPLTNVEKRIKLELLISANKDCFPNFKIIPFDPSIECLTSHEKDISTLLKPKSEEIKLTTFRSNMEEVIKKHLKSKLKNMKLIKNKSNLKESIETIKDRHEIIKTELSILHQKYKTLNSKNLNKLFQETPSLFYEYHEMAAKNEESFPGNEIPRNRIINEIKKIKSKRQMIIADLGCGLAKIAEYFKNDKRFIFHNFDHIAINETVTKADISNVPLNNDSVEICILSLAMWGSNCQKYLKEAHRILETHGTLYIIEPTKRWSEKIDGSLNSIPTGKEASKLIELLEKNNFKIIMNSVNKFAMFTCVKV